MISFIKKYSAYSAFQQTDQREKRSKLKLSSRWHKPFTGKGKTLGGKQA